VNIKTVSVTYSRKFNLGDYNSAEIGVSLWADLEDYASERDALADLFERAKSAVREQAVPIVKRDQNIAAEVTRKFGGQFIKED